MADIREHFGINGGVDTDSALYKAGYVAGNVAGGAGLYGGVAFKYIPALGPSGSTIGHPAYGGQSIRSIGQGRVRFGWGRDSGPTLRLGVWNRHINVLKVKPPAH